MTDVSLNLKTPHAWLLKHAIAPVSRDEDGILTVLVEHPDNVLELDVFSAVEDSPLKVVKGDRQEIRRILMEQAAANRDSVHELTQSVSTDSPDEPLLTGELLAGDPDHPRVIRLVNTILADAVNCRASDVHLEPAGNNLKVRFRVDGMLEEHETIPSEFAAPVVSRVKIMGSMDVSQRTTPQDGGCSVTFGGSPVDLRIATVPTPDGERVVLRLLTRTSDITSLPGLGVPEALTRDIQSIIQQNQGLFLVAGPTGSGKTTTLYACLNKIDTSVRNTMTIEDPVEYDIPGISQIQVGRDRRLTFSDGLRSLLRQDPDVIMVGEIRDGDTAGIALQAALTGHLILSTIHTTDPAAAVIRLLDLGVEPPLIAETLTAIMDQRLIRTLCPHCSQKVNNQTRRNPTGCSHCRKTGYLGRTGLYRYMRTSPDLQHAIRSGRHQVVRELVDEACGNMMIEQAKILLKNGHTDMDEMNRVLDIKGSAQ